VKPHDVTLGILRCPIVRASPTTHGLFECMRQLSQQTDGSIREAGANASSPRDANRRRRARAEAATRSRNRTRRRASTRRYALTARALRARHQRRGHVELSCRPEAGPPGGVRSGLGRGAEIGRIPKRGNHFRQRGRDRGTRAHARRPENVVVRVWSSRKPAICAARFDIHVRRRVRINPLRRVLRLRHDELPLVTDRNAL
jgi:hypothetical protein